MSSSYARGHSTLPSRYVQSPIGMGAAMRYSPYRGGAFNSGPPQKAFKNKENADEYFVPTKKRKVWKLMRFLEKK